jgi:ComF family protein
MTKWGLILSYVKRFIFQVLPPKCPLSGEIVESQGMLSSKAWQSLNFISSPICNCCGLPLEIEIDEAASLLCASCMADPKPYNKARSAIVYDDASRNLILAFKHGDQTHMTLTFVPWLKRAGLEMLDDCDLLVPVPLHWLRLLKRRYNQSALITSRLARETGIAHVPDILKRVRHTPVQGHLSSRDRQKNVAGAFIVNAKHRQTVRGRKIILVDDVFTTGATIGECAETLYAAGALRVDVLTVARVSKPGSMS